MKTIEIKETIHLEKIEPNRLRPELKQPLPDRIYRGLRNHPLYDTWRGLVRRCHDPKCRAYRNYGARGIVVCQRWRDSFWNFAADVGLRPGSEFSLDRKENDKHYEPGNVRWATREEQGRNVRRNRNLTCNSRTQTLEEWSAELGIAKSTLFNRLRRGWSEARTLTAKPQGRAVNHTLLPPGGTALCAAKGIARETVASRMRRGWSFENAISKPIDHRRNRHAAAA